MVFLQRSDPVFNVDRFRQSEDTKSRMAGPLPTLVEQTQVPSLGKKLRRCYEQETGVRLKIAMGHVFFDAQLPAQ